jgi:8-oxo-dGTP diphosphatase
MDCFWCTVVRGKLTLLEAEDARWLDADTLLSVKWLPADLAITDKILQALKI